MRLKRVINKYLLASKKLFLFVCLFWFFVTLENFSLTWTRHHCPVKGCKFWPTLGNHGQQWGFSNVPHLLWHGASVYNSHLQGPVPVTPIAQRLAVELLLPVFYDICLSWVGFEHPTLRLRGECSYPLRHRRGQICSLSGRVKINYLS